MVYGCSFRAHAMPPTLLAYVLVTRQDASTAYFPRPAIATLMAALASLMVTPAITCMLLPVCITVAATVISQGSAAFMTAGSFSACGHVRRPLSVGTPEH